MKKINTYPFFLMVKAIGEIFQEHSSPMAGILFLGNWPEKDAYLWKGQFFKMIFFANLSSDSDSSRKTVWRNCLSFLDILRGSWPNKQKTRFLRVSLTYPYFSRFFANLINFQLEYWKNEDSLCSYFFERNLNLASEYKKKLFWKIDLSIGGCVFQVNFRETRCQIWGWNNFEISHQWSWPSEKTGRHTIFSI